MTSEKPSASPTFDSLFFGANIPTRIEVPNYQRAFAWEEKQIGLFIGDLDKYQGSRNHYYFGHFIVEAGEGTWEVVDGQQRITTFVLFLLVCRQLAPSLDHPALGLIDRFSTVQYDDGALRKIGQNLGAFFDLCRSTSPKKELNDSELIERCALKPEEFTRSQKRIADALRQFYAAFQDGILTAERIPEYLDVIMRANCSLHPAANKSVAVNVFEMHNTRGIPLTTIEIVKAKLMRFVYDHAAPSEREAMVAEIQKEFGGIYRMEELLETKSFRGELTLEQLLRLHLSVVDDGTKRRADEFRQPAANAGADAVVKYLEDRLNFEDRERKRRREPAAAVQYALSVAREFHRSVRLVGDFLPKWDAAQKLVGDVLILERELSCQFFLLIGRMLERLPGEEFGRADEDTLILWERLLFTRDFHGSYYRLSNRDDFPRFFEDIRRDGAKLGEVLLKFVRDGFRDNDVTRNLQKVVSDYVTSSRDRILNEAFHWWHKHKLKYAIYKFEAATGANVRETMKESSLEHILPQEWQWEWIDGFCKETGRPSPEEKEVLLKEIGGYIDGLGNLLLLTRSENTKAGNQHPAMKSYGGKYAGGSYARHDRERDRWRKSSEWKSLIQERGVEILDFMTCKLIGIPEAAPPHAF